MKAHIVIDEHTVDRALTTGHPRLLGQVLKGKAEGVMQGVSIVALTVNGKVVTQK